jgi:hypothetical protein
MEMRKILAMCVLIGVTGGSRAQIPVVDPSAAVIDGRVLYKNGKPVENADIEIHTFGASTGISAQPVQTDKDGHFKITYPPLGEGFISASKPSEGYPNAELALYDRRDSPSMKRINLTPGLKLEHLILSMDEPNPVVTFQVKAGDSGNAIENGRILIQSAAGKDMMISQTIPHGGEVTFVLPDHAVQVVISAPGRRTWHWSADVSAASAAGKPLAMRQTLLVLLQQENTHVE